MTLVLASQSAARRDMLRAAGLDIATDPADIDEGAVKRQARRDGQSADDCTLALARAKAARVAARHPGSLVLGADQILECGGEWFDKPRDVAAARVQLCLLRGRAHALVTACVVADGAALWQCVARARLVMRAFSDEFLDRYVDAQGARLTATVGGYALEGLGAQLFEELEGDYFTILGLPLLPLLGFLRARGALAT